MMNINRNIAISDTGFVFDPSSGDSYSLNPVGTEIIQLLKKQKTIEEIQVEIVSKYEVDDVQLEKDIIDFILTLEQYNLIENNE
ncbi:MAG TPA: HPr-rel-A system PqqD family protein [Bacteroidales bacterium]|nr:HPr-rel-A system PqqD family protein [Bacteroidales bacterium]